MNFNEIDLSAIVKEKTRLCRTFCNIGFVEVVARVEKVVAARFAPDIHLS